MNWLLLLLLLLLLLSLLLINKEHFVVDMYAKNADNLHFDASKLQVYSDKSVTKRIPFLIEAETQINAKITDFFNTIKFKSIGKIDEGTVQNIVKKVSSFFTELKEYNFKVLTIGSVTIKGFIGSTIEPLVVTIPIILYENALEFVKRCYVIVNVDSDKNAMIISIINPKDAIKDPRIYLRDDYDLSKTLPLSKLKEKSKLIINKTLIQKEKERRIFLETLKQTYNCYSIPDSSKVQGKKECEDFKGVWDREVQSDSECPFYLANKNYPNFRGGMKNGYCEMPSGIKIKGFRYYDPEFPPLCYNCLGSQNKNTTGACCEEQKNKILYPNLSSPDYSFPGDTIDRLRN